MKCDKHIVNQKQTVGCCKIIKALNSEIGTQKQTKNINPQEFYKNLSLYGLDGNTFICSVCVLVIQIRHVLRKPNLFFVSATAYHNAFIF